MNPKEKRTGIRLWGEEEPACPVELSPPKKALCAPQVLKQTSESP